MYKAIFQSRGCAWLLALSIAALLPLVNASAESLTAVNPSDKRQESDFSQLVTTVLQTGGNSEFKKNIAPAIGLDKPSPTRVKENKLQDKPSATEFKSCFVVIEKPTEKTPKCVYLAWMKKISGKSETQYYRVSLAGKLEKSITILGDLDSDGKPIKGSGKKVDNDINSPETKKGFDAEMAYWLNDWLKKEQKPAAAKKQAAVAKPAAAAAL